MADEDDTKYCSNCKRDIAAVNFVMHEVHCHRNIVLCEHCDEPVPRSELDTHFEEIHAPVTCDLCGQTVEKSALNDHKEDDCMKRMKQCCFCELEVAFDALQEHQDVCGSRTELCPNCSQYVMLKDQGRHDDSNCAYPAPRATNNQRTSGEEFFMALDQGRMRPHANEWQDSWVSNPFRNATGADLSQRSMNRSKRAPTNAERSQVNARGRGRTRGVSQISRLSSSGALRQLTRVLHANSVPPAPVGNTELRHDVSEALDGNGELRHDVPRAVDTNEFRDDVRRDPVVSGELQRDVTEAPEPLMNNNMQYLTNSLAQDLRSPNNFTSLTSDLQSVTSNTWPAESTESIASEDLTGLPCEFCGESFPADSLLLHQGICSSTVRELPSPPANIPSEVGSNWELSSLPLNPQFGAHDNYMSSPLGNNVLPSGDSAVNHRPSLFHFEDNLNHSTESRRLLHELSRDMSPDLDDPTLMLPCEFCDTLIPEDVLIQHQATCTAGGLESPQPTTSSWQLQRSQAVSETHPQQPRHQPDPVMVDVHRHRKPETGNYRNNWKKKNGPNQKNSGVWGANERNDIPPVDPRWRGPKQLGKCFLPPSVRDVMPKLAPAARNIVGNRATPRNTGTDPGASRRRQGGAAAAASDSLSHVVTEDAAIAVPMSPSVSPADDLENSDMTFVKSVDNDETEGAERRRELGRERRRERGHEPSSLLREVNATPSYEASFASDQTGRARGRRTGGGLPNSQRPAKSGNREGGAPSGGRGRNRNRKGGNQGSRRMPQGDV